MDPKIKAIAVLVLLGGGGFFGWRYLQDSAKSATDEQLLEKFTAMTGGSVSPYNTELQARVEDKRLPFEKLQKIALTDTNKTLQTNAWYAMSFVPKARRDEVFAIAEQNFKRLADTEVRTAMGYAVKEVTLNGLPDPKQFTKVMDFLVQAMMDQTKYGGVTEAVEKEYCKYLKELAAAAGDDRTNSHSKKDWHAWWSTGARNTLKQVPAEVSNKRGKNQ